MEHDQPISSLEVVESIKLNSTWVVLTNKCALDTAKDRDFLMVPFTAKNFTLYPLLELKDFAPGELSNFVKGYLREGRVTPTIILNCPSKRFEGLVLVDVSDKPS